MVYVFEQQTILFYRRILRSQNAILRIVLVLKRRYVLSLLAKSDI